MLALQGNTAPYLLYAYTRTRALFRKAAEEGGIDTTIRPELLDHLAESQELALGKHLCNFDIILDLAAEECRPNYICDYLYELAGLYSQFYENCPVLKSEDPVRGARIALTHLASLVLKQGLELLGLETTEQM
jgi:arginyl-tRNA synthetase